MTNLDFDELHTLVDAIMKTEDEDGVIKSVRTLLKGAYEQAVLDMEDEFQFLFFYEGKMEDALNLEVAGETWEDRIHSHMDTSGPEGGNISPEEGVKRVVETEYHRMYNTGAFDSAKDLESKGKTVYKRWETMKDDRVRPTHSYLEGDAVPLNEAFFTYDGDSAMFPGGFVLAENNVNCRCTLEYEVR